MSGGIGDQDEHSLATLSELRRATTRRMRRGSLFAAIWGGFLCTFAATGLFTDALTGGDHQFVVACGLLGSMGLISAGYGFYVVRDRKKNDVLLQSREDPPPAEIRRRIRGSVLTVLVVGVLFCCASGAFWYVLFGLPAGLGAFVGGIALFGLLFWFFWIRTIGRIRAQMRAPESTT